MKKIIAILLIITLIGSAVILLKKRKQSIKNTPVPSPVTYTVKIVSPKEQRLQQIRPFLAQLVAKEVAGLSSKLSGLIKEVLVSENQLIKKGDILVRIDDREITSTIQALNATRNAQIKEMKYAGSFHARNKAIFEAGGLAREKLDASEVQYFHKQAALETTRQKIAAAQAQLSYLTITAPFDGTVGTIYFQNGSLATPGRPLVSINSSAQKLIFSFVPRHPDIVAGQDVVFQDRTIGRIAKLYSDAKNGLSVAEVLVTTPLARPNNSYLTINVVTFTGSGCTVPVNALLHEKNGIQIMVYENNYFRPVHVTITAQNKKYAMVDPCPAFPVAVGSEAKLSQLQMFGKVRIQQGEQHE